MRSLIGPAVLAIALVGCTDTPAFEAVPAPTPETSEPSSEDLDVIAPPGPDGELPADLAVSCAAGGPTLRFGSLQETSPLGEPGSEEISAAITPFLESEEGEFWPQEGWLLLEETEAEATVVNANQDGYAFMSLVREGDGWNWSGATMTPGCPLWFTVPEGLNSVDWKLDPDSPPPGPDEASVDVILTERECVSGQEIGDRLVEPQVVMTDDSVHIAFAARPPEGEAFNCQGNPEMKYTVRLPAALGDRQLVTGYDTGFDLSDFLP